MDPETELSYFNSLCDGAISGAANHFDTAINFRYQKSERLVNQVLKYLIGERFFQREELIIGSKGGFLQEDEEKGETYEEVVRQLIAEKLIESFEESFFQFNTLNPKVISWQFEKSRRNLGLETIDFYSLNQPELHLGRLSKEEFFSQLMSCFEVLEQKVQEKKLAKYGLASWRAFRVDQRDQFHISLEELTEHLEKKLGKEHSFSLIYLPLNLLQPEGFIEKYQRVGNEEVSFLKAAELLKINVFGISPFCSGLTANLPLPTNLTRANYLAAKHLNLLRSLPYESLKSVVFGAKNNRHVKINLSVSRCEFMTDFDIQDLILESKRRKQEPLTDYNLDHLTQEIIDT